MCVCNCALSKRLGNVRGPIGTYVDSFCVRVTCLPEVSLVRNLLQRQRVLLRSSYCGVQSWQYAVDGFEKMGGMCRHLDWLVWVENVCDLVGTVSKYVGGVRDGMV